MTTQASSVVAEFQQKSDYTVHKEKYEQKYLVGMKEKNYPDDDIRMISF